MLYSFKRTCMYLPTFGTISSSKRSECQTRILPKLISRIFSSLFTRVTLKKVLDRYLTMSIEFSNHFVITWHSWKRRKKEDTFFTDFTFFSQRVPLWATTESKLSKTILGCFFGGAHWPNGRRKRGADARWVLRNTGRKVVKTIWLISRGNDIVNFSVMFIILRIFCGCVGPIQASKV